MEGILMNIFITLSILFSLTVDAKDSKTRELNFKNLNSCFKGVHFDNDWMVVGKSSNVLLIKNMKHQKVETIEVQNGFRDFLINENTLYILRREKIDIYNLDSGVFSAGIDLINSERSWPESLFIKNNLMYVSSDKDGLKIFNLINREKIKTINPVGNINNVFIHNGIGYIYADTAGISGGMILSAVYIFNPSTNEIGHRTFINGAPSGGLYVDEKNVFLGEIFYWQLKKRKVHRKKYIGRYKSVYLPRPQYANGRAYRDQENLYFCNSKANVIKRKDIER